MLFLKYVEVRSFNMKLNQLRTTVKFSINPEMVPFLPTDTIQIYNIPFKDENATEVVKAFIDNPDLSGISTPEPIIDFAWKEDPERLVVKFFDYHGLRIFGCFFNLIAF